VPGGWSHPAVPPCPAGISFPGLGVLAAAPEPPVRPKDGAAANNDPAPVTGTFTNPAQASSAVSKPAGCLERSRHIPMPALRARADANRPHSFS
jgi:hypothetical protein